MPSRMSKDELRRFYGVRAHKAVLYANEEGSIEPDDLIWHSSDVVEEYPYDNWTPVAVIVCHSSDKMYRLPLDKVLADPEAWST